MAGGWIPTVRGAVAIEELGPVLPVPEGVEVTERWQGARRLFLLNHSDRDQEVLLDGSDIDLLAG